MTTGYLIYVKKPKTKTYVACHLENWFIDEGEALARAESLNRTWKPVDDGYDYIVVRLGEVY